MPPKFEKRVRASAIDTAGLMLAILLSIPFDVLYRYIIIIGAALLVYIVPYFFNSGQTFGKRVQQIKVVRRDGSQAGVVRLILRELFKVGIGILTFGVYLVVAFFAMSEKVESRTIHDYIFDTKMIDLAKPTHRKKGDEGIGISESLKKKGL